MDHILGYREERRRITAVNTIPKDMSSAYTEIMQRIKESRNGDDILAKKVLSWIYYAQRTLRMEELLELLIIEDGDDMMEFECILDPSEVIDSCKSLVVYDEASRLVRFAHFTVGEFIKNRREELLISNRELASTLVTFLGFREFDEPCLREVGLEKRSRKYNLCHYATQFWGPHAKGVAEKDPKVQKGILKLILAVNRLNWILRMERYWSHDSTYKSYAKEQTPLYLIARLGLATICEVLLNTLSDETYISLTHTTLLMWSE